MQIVTHLSLEPPSTTCYDAAI